MTGVRSASVFANLNLSTEKGELQAKVDAFLNFIQAKSMRFITKDGTKRSFNKEYINVLRSYIDRNLTQQSWEDEVLGWVEYCQPQMQLHSVLLDAGLDQLEPKRLAIIGHYNQGTALCSKNTLRKRNRKRKLNLQLIRTLRKGLCSVLCSKVNTVPLHFYPSI